MCVAPPVPSAASAPPPPKSRRRCRPRGPVTSVEMFKWPRHLLDRALANGLGCNIQRSLRDGLTFSSCFSGTEFHNVAANLLLHVIPDEMKPNLDDAEIALRYSACDSDVLCREALRDCHAGVRPAHMYTHVMDRLRPETFAVFCDQFDEAMREYTMRSFNGESHKGLVTEFGEHLARTY